MASNKAVAEPVDEMELIIEALERECPWRTCSGILDHEGWRDVAETIKALYPESYQMMLREMAQR